MKVRTKLQICAGVPILLAICLSVGSYRLFDALAVANEALADAGRMVEKGLDLKRAAHVVIQAPTEQSIRHWQAQTAQQQKDISGMRAAIRAEHVIIQDLNRALVDMNVSFLALIESNPEEDGAADRNAALVYSTNAFVSKSSLLMDLRQANMQDVRVHSLVWLFAMAVLFPGILTITAGFLSRRISVGITELHEATQHISEGNLDYEVKISSSDELGALGNSFNRMTSDLKASQAALTDEIVAHKKKAEALRVANKQIEDAMAKLKRAQTQIIQQERLLALQQISSGIMRDFNEALTPIIGVSEMFKADRSAYSDPAEMQEAFELIHRSATRATKVIKQLALFFSPQGRVRNEPVDMRVVMEKAISLTRPMWKEQMEAQGVRINLDSNLQEVRTIDGDPDDLLEALTNLVINAVDAMPNGGSLWCTTAMEDNEVVVGIRDNGKGMDADTLRCCPEPFFSTKEDAPGMGLTVVSGTVGRHDGTVDISSEPRKGTWIRMRFPAGTPSPVAESTVVPDPSEVPPLRILTIDDDAAVSTVMARMLELGGHSVSKTSSGLEGVRQFAEAEYDLVITDRAMPDLSGDEVAHRIKEISPDTPVLMITGFGSMMKEKGEHPEFVDRILNKPYTRDELLGSIAAVLQTSSAPSI